MANYIDLLEAVVTRGTVTIQTPVKYSALRRGINKLIRECNESAEIMDDDSMRFKGEVSIREDDPVRSIYTLTYYPDGRPLPECFQPKFEFKIVEPDNPVEKPNEDS